MDEYEIRLPRKNNTDVNCPYCGRVHTLDLFDDPVEVIFCRCGSDFSVTAHEEYEDEE